jgi:hypothetical protein
LCSLAKSRVGLVWLAVGREDGVEEGGGLGCGQVIHEVIVVGVAERLDRQACLEEPPAQLSKELARLLIVTSAEPLEEHTPLPLMEEQSRPRRKVLLMFQDAVHRSLSS